MKWIVIGSGCHTLGLQPVIFRYPDAQVIGPPQAEAKLNIIEALPRGKLDYDSTNADQLAQLNSILAPEGVKLMNVDGDVVTNALLVIFEDQHLLQCDLLYARTDGGFMSLTKERFYQFLPEDWILRLFWFMNVAKPNSPHGYLPAYRYQLMDPNSMGILLHDQPRWDGTSCEIMADSLRRVIKAKFEFVHGVHFDQQLEREVYVSSLDVSWNWLDGKSLV